MTAIRRRVRTDLQSKWVDIYDLSGQYDLGQVLKVDGEWVFYPEDGSIPFGADQLREIAAEVEAMRVSDNV